MKKRLLLILLTATGLLANAQSTSFHAFKVDIDYGVVLPTGYPSGSTEIGGLFSIDPHYALSDQFALGLRLELGATGYEEKGNTDFKTYIFDDVAVTGNYYFSAGVFRPFTGLGIGSYSQQEFLVLSDEPAPTTTRLQMFPMVGFEVYHFRLAAEYDIISDHLSYFTLKAGFFFGGSRKRNK